ncbi:MAG TPA: response regulator receiver protein [Bacteroidetes bacterium]|nr:response regulator receiver protein [Bacteroidota bacterium]
MIHTILLVDDDPIFIKLVSPLLSNEGYSLLTAGDASDAQEILAKNHEHVSVILLDWEMPQMTGIELLKWIRAQPQYESIQVIMQTGMDKPENIKEGIDAGAYYYLTKPVKREVLLSTIHAAVEDHLHQKELLTKLRLAENSFRLLDSAVFRYRSVAEGEFLAVRIANICANPEEAMYVSELLTNAVEHGNLAITYEEKTILIEKGNLQDEIQKRLALPDYQKRMVHVSLKKEDGKLHVLVEDEGSGFDYEKYLRFDDSRVFDNHGRGIAIVNSYLDMKYLDKGNKVLVKLALKPEMN